MLFSTFEKVFGENCARLENIQNHGFVNSYVTYGLVAFVNN